MLKFFDESDSSPSRESELPWMNEYMLSPLHDINKPYPIKAFVLVQKGIIVITDNFKAFLWKEQRVVSHLKEAISIWKDGLNECPGLFCLTGEKASIAFDTDITDVYAKIIDSKRIDIIWGKPNTGTMPTTVNPFVPFSPPPLLKESRASKRGKDTSTEYS